MANIVKDYVNAVVEHPIQHATSMTIGGVGTEFAVLPFFTYLKDKYNEWGAERAVKKEQAEIKAKTKGKG